MLIQHTLHWIVFVGLTQDHHLSLSQKAVLDSGYFHHQIMMISFSINFYEIRTVFLIDVDGMNPC